MRNRVLVAITLIIIIIFIIMTLLKPVFTYLKNKRIKNNNEKMIDDDLNNDIGKSDGNYFTKQVIIRIFNSLISTVLVIMFGVYVKDTRVIMVSILPIGCLILWIYVLIKKG